MKIQLTIAILLGVIALQTTYLTYQEFTRNCAVNTVPDSPDSSSLEKAWESISNPLGDLYENLFKSSRLAVAKLSNPGISETEVRAYLDELTQIASLQGGWSSESPVSQAIKKLRSEDVPIILEYLDTDLKRHCTEAITALATVDQKEILIEAFREHEEVRGAIERFGWARDCPRIIETHLRSSNVHLKYQWAALAAATQDQGVYRAMIDAYIEESENFGSLQLYDAMIAAVDFPIAELHDRIWMDSKNGPFQKKELDDVIHRCINNGSVLAFISGARILATRDRGGLELEKAMQEWAKLETTIKRRKGFEGNALVIIEHENDIVFDVESGKFILSLSDKDSTVTTLDVKSGDPVSES